MGQWLEWLLDLQDIRLVRDAPLLLRWDRPFRAWELFLFALAAIAGVLMVYRREAISPARKVVLGGIRCAAVALVVVILAQPTLVHQRNRIEASHVVLAVDTSLSMAIRDTTPPFDNRQAPTDNASALPRLETVKRALTRDDSQALRTLLSRQEVHLCSFDGRLEPRGYFSSTEALPTLIGSLESLVADGAVTDVAGAITRTMEQASGRRLSAIVLASDGRSTQTGGLEEAIRLARGRQIPIFPIRIGSTVPPFDLELGSVRAKEAAFVHDVLPVEVQILATGLIENTPVDLQLVDERSGAVVATERVLLDPGRSAFTVELRTKPSQPGMARYRVEASSAPRESTTENNMASFTTLVLDRKLRVLYVDGYPRYEYRYLKNALMREPTIELSVLLLEADEEFIQEGTDPIRRFPETAEELARYDVILLGDVDPRGGWLSTAQAALLADYVAKEGGGFGVIAGERFCPHQFRGTPLEKLLPVRIDPTFQGRYESTLTQPVQLRLTPDGHRSGLFRFSPDRSENQRIIEELPAMYWAARTLGPKPGALVLAEPTESFTAPERPPLVVTSRYGAGRLFFQATDDTWRWRRHSGELLHDAYWVQVVRELMPVRSVAAGRRFMIRTDRRVYPYGAGVRTQVEIIDPAVLAGLADAFPLTATESVAGDAGESGSRSPFDVHRLGPQSPIFEGTWVPPRPGSYVLDAAALPTAADDPSPSGGTAIRVDPPNLESRRPDADHDALLHLAEATSGRLLELDDLPAGLAEIRDRSAQLPDDVIEPLWDSKLALALFMLLLSGEWIGRKASNLL